MSIIPSAPCPTIGFIMPGLQRSDVWFADGNVVLAVGGVAFKVHRGQLERHSEVFCDLFSFPQPPSSCEASDSMGEEPAFVEGCPLVQLFGDAPGDVRCLLVALYDGMYFANSSPNHFPIVAAVLRLSTKYIIDHLREQCLALLTHDWPSTLATWDRRETDATFDQPANTRQAHSGGHGMGSARGGAPVGGRYAPRDVYAHPVLVLRLAGELGLNDIMTAAFYDLSRYGPSKITSGTLLPVRKVLNPSAQGHGESGGDGQECEINLEDANDRAIARDLLVRTLRGREHAQRFVLTFLERAVRAHPSRNCVYASRAARPSTFIRLERPGTYVPFSTPAPSYFPNNTVANAPAQGPPPPPRMPINNIMAVLGANPLTAATTPTNAPIPLTYPVPAAALAPPPFGTDTAPSRAAAAAAAAAAATAHTHAQAQNAGGQWDSTPRERGQAGGPCFDSFYFVQLNVLRAVGGIACGRDADPLYALKQAGDMLERTDFSDGVRQCALRMCAVCKSEFREAVKGAREEVWTRIPEWFGIDGWEARAGK
ncbi:hypothetical protein CONPUDRAFT_168007 [Coniophora puteana RWD-64-598 SS2]|uniref:BTB domain-containing protein n=1 Tax=Coniophora puteana (strain RWD-64-598) TaxID=741705 RepID=A0A5M3MHE6_CONPW|nr:uncharacterized protein CONPUDRAFT_168007 [Coniophora puteana RWD-64-598 SS2]EIW78055.1 hypothetical protein CONPUDRAFT_168007 [Coniophora puteana RWD-64-598 SS2]